LACRVPPDYEQFKRLIHGLDPHTGEQLTAKLIEDRIPGWDVTASATKGVTTALERGDARIRQALWEAGREGMADLEAMATTRVRKGGRQEDRHTGNLLWYAKEDAETRPAKEDRMPDWDRHIHFVVFNVTHDAAEDEWKAVKFRPIMDLRKWFSHRFYLRLSHKLSELGYDLETKYKAEGRGGKRYYSWDIKDIPASVVKKFSRRTEEVDAIEPEALADLQKKVEEENRKKGTNKPIPQQLSPVARDKLGATSRLHKRDDLTLDDYRAYWNSRITPEEGRQIAGTIQRAREGRNPKPANTAEKGVAYAIGHEFARNSVVTQKQLEITAMERCMGAALPEEIEPQLRKQNVLLIDGYATSEQVRAEEQRLVDFARRGRGRFRPLGDPDRPNARDWLNAGQRGAVKHEVGSRDRVTIVRGVSGAGKTSLMQEAVEGIEEGGKKVSRLFPHCWPIRMCFGAVSDADRSVVSASGKTINRAPIRVAANPNNNYPVGCDRPPAYATIRWLKAPSSGSGPRRLWTNRPTPSRPLRNHRDTLSSGPLWISPASSRLTSAGTASRCFWAKAASAESTWPATSSWHGPSPSRCRTPASCPRQAMPKPI